MCNPTQNKCFDFHVLMINCNVEGFRVKTIIRDLREDVKFWLNNWIDQWPGSGRRPEESGSWSDGSLVFSSWTRCGDVLTRPVTPIITSTELFHRKLQKTKLLNKNIWKCCHSNYNYFVRVLVWYHNHEETKAILPWLKKNVFLRK